MTANRHPFLRSSFVAIPFASPAVRADETAIFTNIAPDAMIVIDFRGAWTGTRRAIRSIGSYGPNVDLLGPLRHRERGLPRLADRQAVHVQPPRRQRRRED